MITEFKKTKDEVRRSLRRWLREYDSENNLNVVRQKNGGVLQGKELDDFVGALQDKVVEVINEKAGGFAENIIGDDANLALYSGTDFDMVKDMCAKSDGQYYMISQTAADVLWDEAFRDDVAHVDPMKKSL